jgi:hypothetical protein
MINKPIIETCNDYILNDFNKRTWQVIVNQQYICYHSSIQFT